VYCVTVEVRQQGMLKVDAVRRMEWSADGATAGLLWQSLGEGDSAISADEAMGWSFSTEVTTWRTGMIGTVGTSRDPAGTIRNSVRDLVDELVNDYLGEQQERKELEELFRKLEKERKEEEADEPG